MEMDISEVSREAGVPASTIRFYEEKGLIRSCGRRGLRRTFRKGVLERLALIALGRSAGFSLDEMGRLFSGERGKIDRAMLLSKADELDDQIRHLSFIRDNLRHAACCPAPSHMQCRKFRQLLRMAMRTQRRARRGVANRGPGAAKTSTKFSDSSW